MLFIQPLGRLLFSALPLISFYTGFFPWLALSCIFCLFFFFVTSPSYFPLYTEHNRPYFFLDKQAQSICKRKWCTPEMIGDTGEKTTYRVLKIHYHTTNNHSSEFCKSGLSLKKTIAKCLEGIMSKIADDSLCCFMMIGSIYWSIIVSNKGLLPATVT